jgi:hypothetical protein
MQDLDKLKDVANRKGAPTDPEVPNRISAAGSGNGALAKAALHDGDMDAVMQQLLEQAKKRRESTR